MPRSLSASSPATLLADSFNVQAGWRYLPVPEERIILEKSQRLVVRITVPADELTLNGTLVFEEIGRPAQLRRAAARKGPGWSARPGLRLEENCRTQALYGATTMAPS